MFGADDSRSPRDRYLPPGTKVRHAFEPGGWEYGIVVACWTSSEIQGYDCYVACFGDALPAGAPSRKPYVLRYAATSLEVLA